MSALASPCDRPVVAVRRAYSELHEPEKGSIMRFIARRRFTDETFEAWVRLAGLQTGEVRREAIAERQLPMIRERLDAALLDDANGELLGRVVGSFLRDDEPELSEEIVAWVQDHWAGATEEDLSASVRGALESEVLPAAITGHPWFGLVRAALVGGLLDEWLKCLAAEVDGDRKEAKEESVTASGTGPARRSLGLRKAWDELQRDLDALAAAVERLRTLPEPGSEAGITESLRVNLARVEQMRADLLAAGVSSWKDAADLADQIRQLREPHSFWAESLGQYLAERAVNHPLRRKRETFEQIREMAREELQVLAGAVEVDGDVPGPAESAAGWWAWATGLDEAGFEAVDLWCSRNGLERLADLVAEEWTGIPKANLNGKNGAAAEPIPGERLPANGNSEKRSAGDSASVETGGMGLAGLAARRLNGPEPGPRSDGENNALSVRSLRLAMESVEAARRPVTGAVGSMQGPGPGGSASPFAASFPSRLS